MKTKKNIDLSTEEKRKWHSLLSDLKIRARRVNYKNEIPHLPKKPTSSTMSGFRGRLGNWLKVLENLEKEKLLHTNIRATYMDGGEILKRFKKN